MDFDQIGEQHVSRRRKPPRTPRQSLATIDSGIRQHVYPRHSYSAKTPVSAKVRPIWIDDSSSDETWWKRISSPQGGGKQKKTRQPSGGIISASFIKYLAIAGGVLVIAIIGPNWENISEWFKQREVSFELPPDSMPFIVRNAGIDLIPVWEPGTPLAAAEAPGLLLEDMQLNVTEPFAWTEYRIKEGDSIYRIASKFSLSMQSIIAFNGLKEAWHLRVGQTLRIPNMDGIPYTVQKNDNLTRISEKHKIPVNAILDANDLPSDTIQAGLVIFLPGAKMDAAELTRAIRREVIIAKPMTRPVSGRITSGYGWRIDPVNPRPGVQLFHKAIDLSGTIGEPVLAAMGGTVLHVDNNSNLGNFIILRHGEYQTLYAHLSALSVKRGDTVRQGQEIGKIGNTGYTTGPHLHFAAFRNGVAVNPLDLIK
jgi:murein DD-endopeptidase MepM/ murein hydrolase activator NlpD